MNKAKTHLYENHCARGMHPTKSASFPSKIAAQGEHKFRQNWVPLKQAVHSLLVYFPLKQLFLPKAVIWYLRVLKNLVFRGICLLENRILLSHFFLVLFEFQSLFLLIKIKKMQNKSKLSLCICAGQFAWKYSTKSINSISSLIVVQSS